MPLDPNILLQRTTPDVMSALSRGIQAGQSLRQAPILEAMQRQKIEQGKAQQQQQQQTLSRQRIGQVAGLAAQAKAIPTLAGRQEFVNQNAEALASIGIDINQIGGLDDASLDRIIGLNQAVNPQATDPRLALQQRTLDIREQERKDRLKILEGEAVRAGEKKRATLTAEKEIAPSIVKQKALAKDSVALSTEIFGRIDNVEQNIRNMQEGIELIDQGAAVGPIDKWLPSFKESSVKMDNLKNRLGLDVIGSVTFGALSAGELKTAFDTAVPSNLTGEPLKRWFQERIEKQAILLDSLEEAGIFLADEGATIPKLMAKRRQDRKAAQAQTAQPQAQPQAAPQQRGEGQIMIDAQGNRARVFADGTFEEL